MNNINTGGPAFPGLHPSSECRYKEEGMTLRDYFAAKALSCYMADVVWHKGTYEAAAKAAYAVADAMLKAREA